MENINQPNLSDDELNRIFENKEESKAKTKNPEPKDVLTTNNLQAEKIEFPDFGLSETNVKNSEKKDTDKNMTLLLDIPMSVSVELGRTNRTLKEILNLSVGSIVELEKLSGEPVDLLVNGKVIAKAEVVVIDENFGIRITQIIDPNERVK